MSRREMAAAVALCLTVISSTAASQERRRSPDGGSGAPPITGPTHPRVPYAGAWEGTRRMDDGPGSEGMPYAIVIEADSAGRKLAAFVVLPGGERVPVQHLTDTNGVLSWQQPNSGGGTWHYSAHLVGRERLQGTLVLRDWPQGGGSTPGGRFTLVRRPTA